MWEQAAAAKLKGRGEGADVVVVAHPLQRAEVKVCPGTIPLGSPFAQPVWLELEGRVARFFASPSEGTPEGFHNLAQGILFLWTPRGEDINKELSRGYRNVLNGRQISLVLEVSRADDVVVLRVRRRGVVDD